jgi:exopolysaccharide biosynthesis protein
MQVLKTLLSLTLINSADAAPYQYECRKADNHVVHIITLSPQDYTLELVKAHNHVFGRETVESIALRSNADIAINGGFFEIGHGKDGMPSGTLVIDGQIMGLRSQNHACLIKKNNQLSIGEVTNMISFHLGDKRIPILKFNQFPEKDDNVLYSSSWGSSTLTPFKGRQEIAIAADGHVLGYEDHGNTPIPPKGYVLPLPSSYPLEIKDLKKRASLDVEDSLLGSPQEISAVMGIPQLIKDGKINTELAENKNNFYKTSQARTAIGLKHNGDIVIVVAEHAYKKPLTDITLGEVRSILQNNKIKLSVKYLKPLNKLTMDELKEIVKAEFTSPHAAVGLTLEELATLMLEKGCSSALNLDGGGSSTLWREGKVINQASGDEDEAMGQSVLRPVSDGIVLKRKSLANPQ